MTAVHHVEREDEIWRIYFHHFDKETSKPLSDTYDSITADTVVLGAGMLGSTEILLRSKAAGLPVSDQAGERNNKLS